MKVKKEKVTCELFDKMNYICRKYSDRMARMGFRYDFPIDEAVFKAVITNLLDTVPMFRSSIHDNLFRLYWQKEPYDVDEIVKIIRTDDERQAKVDFFSSHIGLDATYQIVFALVYCGGGTSVYMLWNHMCMDGSAGKTLFHDICAEYNRRTEGGTGAAGFKTGARKYTAVYSDMDRKTRLRAKWLYNFSAMSGKCVFPFTSPASQNDQTLLCFTDIDSETMAAAKAKAKKEGATVNDLTVAAFAYALSQMPGFVRNGLIDIMCTVDLRRHLKDPEKLGYTNLSTPFTCFVDSRKKSFDSILSDVKKENSRTKADPFIGLHGLPLLNLGWTSMVYKQAALVVGLFYRNPRLCVSNVGVVEPSLFLLAGHEPVDIFVAGPAKDKPYFLVNSMSLNGRMLLSSTVKGTQDDKEAVERFFDKMKDGIREYAFSA